MIQSVVPKFFDILYDEKISSLVTLNEIRDAFHSNQIFSKNKAIAAYDSIHVDNCSVLFIGSWFGVMTNYILQYYNCYVTEIDVDMRCRQISTRFNHKEPRYLGHYTADINVFDRMNEYDVIINLSTEHMNNDWFNRVKTGTKVVIQNNNLKIDDHINNCNDLEEMKTMYKLDKVLYENTLELNIFNRFTLAGIK